MDNKFKQLTNYFIEIGADQIGHSNKTYMAHAIGVHRDLQAWGCDEELCRAGLFHSIYGTEGFQDFTLPLERQEELRALIGERAERLAYWNCMMDRATLDANLERRQGPYLIQHRLTGETVELSAAEFNDLCRLHLCDWLEQVPRSQVWHYRRAAYRQMAERLGGVALAAYERVFAAEPRLNPAEQTLVLRDDNQGVTTLTLNRPDQYNALSQAMLSALQTHLDNIAADDSVRVVVIAAEGKAFCAGHDLKEMRANPGKLFQQALFEQCSRMMMSLNRLPQPVIAKVQGLATAAGCQLVAACDLAVAAATARFATSGIRVGLFCATPAVAVSRNLSRKQAFEMLVTGEFIDAQTALQQGLVNRVVPEAGLEAAVQTLVEAIVSKSPLAVATGKAMFYKQLELGMAEAYTYASEVMAGNMMAEDAAEGIDAFLEKRQPVWRGR